MMTEILCAFLGYLSGCIQSSYLIGRLILKKDIREHGNGNAGASNATVSFGVRYGVIIALIDILKGTIPLIIIKLIFNETLPEDRLISLLYITGLLIIVGHNFPFFMGFRGGKGTATGVGIMFGLDYRVGLVAVLLMLLVVYLTDYIVIATMSLLVLMIIYTAYFNLMPIPVISVLIIVIMSVWKHRKNFVRIRNGTELKVRASVLKDKEEK